MSVGVNVGEGVASVEEGVLLRDDDRERKRGSTV